MFGTLSRLLPLKRNNPGTLVFAAVRQQYGGELLKDVLSGPGFGPDNIANLPEILQQALVTGLSTPSLCPKLTMNSLR